MRIDQRDGQASAASRIIRARALRPKGAEALTSAQLLGELARELGKPAADLAEALASARGAGARPAALLNVFSSPTDNESPPIHGWEQSSLRDGETVLDGGA